MRELDGEIVVGVGQHPYWSEGVANTDALCDEIQQRCVEYGAVAIGECGLDKGRGAPLSEQVTLFEAQLSLAGQMGLPIVIHQVGAQKELLECLERVGLPDAGGVVHGFSGDTSWGRALQQRGLLLGIGLAVTKTERRRLRAAVSDLPVDRMMLETDAPDQGPGGRSGLPVDLTLVRDAVAELKDLAPEIVAEVTARAARLFYQLEDSEFLPSVRF